MENVAARVVAGGLAAVAGASGRSWGIGESPRPERLLPCLGELEGLLAEGGGFLAGGAVSLADLAVYPFLERFEVALRVADGRRSRLGVVKGMSAAVGAWMESMQSRPSCGWIAADEALLLEAYSKHRCMDFFDYHSYGVWDLHPKNRVP